MTVYEIIQSAVSDGLGLPRTPIQNDVLLEGISRYNKVGKLIFDRYPWDNAKSAIAEVSPTSGIITFASTVDIVRAIRPKDTTSTNDNQLAIWPQDDVNAALQGVAVSSNSFKYLADDSSGNRRIQVNTDDGVTTYYALTLLRFVSAIVDPSYSASSPTDTPTDYRVLQFPIDVANSALASYMADEMRAWDGQPREDKWQEQLQIALNRVQNQSAREVVVYPYDSGFNDLDWSTADSFEE